MVGVEIDMVVGDSLQALALYEAVFDIERLEVTACEKGLNEAIFLLYGTRVHMLDENAEYQLIAPKPGDPKPMWVNLLVPDIRATYAKALEAGFQAIQTLTEMPEMGAINALLVDPYGYLWMLHQIERSVGVEERTRILEQAREG